MSHNLLEKIDAVLPQTQCRECGYAGCRPYAEAIAHYGETINKCPPGGVETLQQLAELTGQDANAYLAEVSAKTRPPQIAVINEEDCIGCTKCIQACPVDAIIGAAKQMHTILTDECTGCELCIAPCPVDCIDLQPCAAPQFDKQVAKSRYLAKKVRQQTLNKTTTASATESSQKKAFIAAALARVNAKQKDPHTS